MLPRLPAWRFSVRNVHYLRKLRFPTKESHFSNVWVRIMNTLRHFPHYFKKFLFQVAYIRIFHQMVLKLYILSARLSWQYDFSARVVALIFF
jgi:hypothetical protein